MGSTARRPPCIERFLEEIEGVEEEDLHGYRVKLQYIGKVTLSTLLRNPALTSAALKENVLCQYLVLKDVCIKVIYNYYMYVCSRGLFSGDAAGPATIAKQCLLVQLLNTFGLRIWKFSSYVRHVDSGDLPPFVRAVMQVKSVTSFHSKHFCQNGHDIISIFIGKKVAPTITKKY